MKTRRVFVEYTVPKIVTYMGVATLDVPESGFDDEGNINLNWVRCNFPEHALEISDEDIADGRLGVGMEEAIGQ